MSGTFDEFIFHLFGNSVRENIFVYKFDIWFLILFKLNKILRLITRIPIDLTTNWIPFGVKSLILQVFIFCFFLLIINFFIIMKLWLFYFFLFLSMCAFRHLVDLLGNWLLIFVKSTGTRLCLPLSVRYIKSLA